LFGGFDRQAGTGFRTGHDAGPRADAYGNEKGCDCTNDAADDKQQKNFSYRVCLQDFGVVSVSLIRFSETLGLVAPICFAQPLASRSGVVGLPLAAALRLEPL